MASNTSSVIQAMTHTCFPAQLAEQETRVHFPLRVFALRYNGVMGEFIRKIPAWLVVLVAGAVFLVIGIFSGGFEDTLRKAALVCYECIGIG